MDPRLLRAYTDELNHLRESGAEFAAAFPKIAGRLGMDGTEVADPYVERLLEGFAFLAARVQVKIDSEHPRLIAHLLESIHPDFLAPLPSMMVARFDVDAADPNLLKGFTVPRGAAVVSEHARGQDTRCEFRTAQDVVLWPLEIAAVDYVTTAADVPLARVPQARGYRGALRIRLCTGGELRFDQLALDRLVFCVGASDDVAFRLHELVDAHPLGTWVRVPGSPDAGPRAWRGADSVRPVGFADDEALLPGSGRTFSGHRLLQEVAAMPRRLLFFSIEGLRERFAAIDGREAEIVVFLAKGDPSLEAVVDRAALALHCTPAINLFEKRLDRVVVGDDAWEYHVVADRTKPMDFEVHSVLSVTGFGTGRVAQQAFAPLYASRHDDDAATERGYFTVRREPRLLSPRQRVDGPRSAYVGDEVYLSLVDPQHAPYDEDLRQLSVLARVTNRDLPTLLPKSGSPGGGTPWRLDTPGPVRSVDVLHGPTRPASRRVDGAPGWSLVNLLSINHRALVDEDPRAAAQTLRRLLALHAPADDAAWQKQVDGVRALDVKSVVRMLPTRGPLTFGCGVSIALELDDLAFQGSSAYLMAATLERFFARHAAINAFTQLTMSTLQRGEVRRWPPRIGERSTL